METLTTESRPGIMPEPHVPGTPMDLTSQPRNVLAHVKAVDIVFQQRVLPVLRGRAPKVFCAHAASPRLARQRWFTSVRHGNVSEAIALADVNFGDIDFFAY